MEAPNRLIMSMVGLAGLWVLVYWLWPAQPAVRFAVAADGTRTEIVPASEASASASQKTQGTDGVQSRGNEAESQPAENGAARQTPTSPPTAILVPRFRNYTVQAGDTLSAIAEKELGNAKLGSVIAQANQLMSPAHLKAGRVIRIPVDPSNVQGVAVQVSDDGSSQRVATKTPTLPVAEYVVRKGDSLAGISRRVYGSEKYADFLFEANKSTLTDASSIKPGQTLRVPQLSQQAKTNQADAQAKAGEPQPSP